MIGWVLFALFVVLPILEIYLLVQIGGWTSIWWVVGLVVATALLGSVLLKREGSRVWREFLGDLQAGRVPARPMVQGFILAAAGAFLLTPGIITDALGLLAMVPAIRRGLAGWTVKRLAHRVTVSRPAGAAGGEDVQPEYRVR